MPEWYVQNNRNKAAKYEFPEGWYIGFKNKCFFCNKHEDGFRRMQGHLKYCKTITTPEEDYYLDSQDIDNIIMICIVWNVLGQIV